MWCLADTRTRDRPRPREDTLASTTRLPILRARAGELAPAEDLLAVEEPLEIRVGFTHGSERQVRSVSITMRTPGDDFALAAGFLFTEGIVRRAADVAGIRHCGLAPADTGAQTGQGDHAGQAGQGGQGNVVRVDLAAGVDVDLGRLQRHFYTTSSCGVCGKTSLDALVGQGLEPIAADGQRVPLAVLHRLPDALRQAQPVFDQTGGLHAAGLFDADGRLLALHEDVGRHNAVDKLIGARLLGHHAVPPGAVLMLSGRASFEILQKAVAARIPLVAAVGAPSSLAVDLAQRFGVTLIGFLREGRCNVYSGAQRIAVAHVAGGERHAG